ncbi:MAG TPA: hypothetical protein VN670_11465 [Acidobacteriaceae bacterium]|nr:hypothetical protein [Acidobacteriaceae bacterium]
MSGLSIKFHGNQTESLEKLAHNLARFGSRLERYPEVHSNLKTFTDSDKTAFFAG